VDQTDRVGTFDQWQQMCVAPPRTAVPVPQSFHALLSCLLTARRCPVPSRPAPFPITCAPCRHGHSQPAVASGTTHTAKLSTNDKKKHQITWLAAQAKDQQQALEQHWASGAAAKRAARQRYGFH
jgi:hypothetical protein